MSIVHISLGLFVVLYRLCNDQMNETVIYLSNRFIPRLSPASGTQGSQQHNNICPLFKYLPFCPPPTLPSYPLPPIFALFELAVSRLFKLNPTR